MLQLAGQDLTGYFPIPFTVSCPGLVTDETLTLQRNFTPIADYAVHWSGRQQNYGSAALADNQWYPNKFLPFMKDFYKGDFVYSKGDIQGQADSGAKYVCGVRSTPGRLLLLTASLLPHQDLGRLQGRRLRHFGLPSDPHVLRGGQQQQLAVLVPRRLDHAALPESARQGPHDPHGEGARRDERDLRRAAVHLPPQRLLRRPDRLPRHATLHGQQLHPARLLGHHHDHDRRQVYVALLPPYDHQPCQPNAPTHLPPLAVLAALQLSSKRNPEMLDKFVICQVPCYTEGEESLRTTIDSLAALQYDDKRKLMFIICDGNIYGSGNDKPTPRIVLDILGVDEKVEADPLMFKSVAEGSKQINYGKVYSGLYEFEGHVVPCVQPV
jgi:hypothetical protein